MSSQSFLERLKDKMSGSFSKPALSFADLSARKKSRHNVITNRYDEQVWTEARKTGSIEALITDLSVGDEHRGGSRKPFDPAPELVKDVFMTFYKAAPELLPKRLIEKEVYPSRKIVDEILNHPDVKEYQAMTSSDPAMSLIAVTAMGDSLREIIGRVPPPPGDTPQGQGGEPDTCGGHHQGETGGQPGEPGGPGQGEGGVTDVEMEFDPDGNPIDPTEADWQDYEDLMEDIDFEHEVRKGMAEAGKEVDDLDEARRGIGLEDGEWRQMSPEDRLKMAQRLSTPEMKTLAEVIGRMKRFALGVKATRVTDVPHEAYDVETGNDLRRLLRSEFALLGTPETTYEFYRKYNDKELLQFKMRGKEDVGKGPIVIAIDKSGSMYGGPFNWAMGVAEALRRFASEEDRDYYAMFFGNNNDRNRFDFPGGKGPFEKVMSFLSVEPNGGTQFDGVLTEALNKATASFDQEGKPKADIVFVTDGQSNLSEDWIRQFNEERNRVGVRVYSVYIGGAYDMGGRGGPLELLERISDAVIPVKDLRPESVEVLFQKI